MPLTVVCVQKLVFTIGKVHGDFANSSLVHFSLLRTSANTDIFALLKKQMKDITVQFFSFSM